MANPRIENGYTRIANELLEAICRLSISGNEMRILLYIIRRTYGFNKSYAEIPLSDISEAVGVRREHIQKALKKLSNQKVIELHTNNGVRPQTISIEKNYEKWNVENCASCLLQKLATVAENGNTTVAENGNTTVAENGNTTVAENCNTTYKERKKENIKERERKNPSSSHIGKYKCSFVKDDNYNELVTDYGKSAVEAYFEKVDRWAYNNHKYLGECSETIKKWLEQDDVPKDNSDISEYASVINKFLPL